LSAPRRCRRRSLPPRTEAGIAKAKAQGKKFGRPSALDVGQKRKIAQRYAAGETMEALAAEYEVWCRLDLAGAAKPFRSGRVKRRPRGKGERR
jgi:hypothetical protein